MSNEAHLLPPELAAAAAAIANARGMRGGAAAVRNILDVLPGKLFREVVEDAREALKAAAGVTGSAPPAPRPHGDLRTIDVDVLRLGIGAVSLVAIARNRQGRATAVFSAIASETEVLGHDEGAQDLFSAVAAFMRAREADARPPAQTEPKR